VKFSFPFTPRQLEMVTHPARILWVGTATKTGKSAGSYCWLIEGLLKAQACGFVGAWFYRSKRAFDECKNLLQPFIAARTVRVNEGRLQITAAGGGYIDFLSGDNPDSLFGSNFDRLVLDESSRMPRAIHAAALTVISATGGKLRCLFNLELGQKNWSIANLLRVQRMTPEERVRASEDFMCFPTDPLLVDPQLVQTLKNQMPLQLWQALYEAKIPDSDCSLFRNLDKIFVGVERETPADGVRYFMGVDLARKQDFTSATVIDEDGNVCAMERFSQMDWSLQVGKVALLYRTFRCVKCVADSTGIGDPVCEQLEDLGLEVERYTFTVPSRKALLEELILACDNREFTVPASSKFEVYRAELESFEYQLDGVTAKYAAPGHDDTVFSLALAVHGFRQSRGALLGVLELLKRKAKEIAEGIRDAFGELIHKPAPKPIVVSRPVESKPTVVDNFAIWQRTHKAPPCSACGATCTTYNSSRQVHCNQCRADDGVLPVRLAAGNLCWVDGCGLPLLMSGSVLRCQNHGQIPIAGNPPNGASRRDHAASQDIDAKIRRSFGRFA
jgi:hypothetical protein